MSSKPTLNVCLVGQKFMGRTHSNAYLKVAKFFDVPLEPVMHTIAGRDAAELEAFARRWGWKRHTTDWKAAVTDPEIDLVDIGVPNDRHMEMAIAALEAGKHVACEKPLAHNMDHARAMRDAAKRARKSKTFVWYNYRRVPAVALAHQLCREGRLGRIYQIRCYYLQDWAADPNIPLIWRFQQKVAGSGSHGDLGAHVIDMARFVTGDEFVEVSGALAETFVKERPIPSVGSAGGIAGGSKASSRMGKVDVDDVMLFFGKMKSGAVVSVEATRFSTGYQNKNGLEVHGDKGAVRFNFEDMNVLDFYDATLPRKVQGWTRIMVTHGGDHPYAHAWWPDAHIIGYEHGFINMTADILMVLGGQSPTVPLPDFEDAFQTQRVLHAASLAAQEKRPVRLSEVK
ncbi:MAG: Gfo/Idh/MocA family protein [Tepidisphaerales bacterium]